jgi:hypothetical protein
MTEATITERDLRPQASGLGGLEKEVLFQHIRTGQSPVTIWAMADGEELEVPEHIVASAMQKKDAEGNWMFTMKKGEAPPYVGGTVLCFLHADSPERESGVLDKIGLAGKRCPKGNLASEHSKRIHAATRHHKEQEAHQYYLDREEKQEDRDAQRGQLAATLALAGKATGQVEPVSCSVEGCDYEGTKRQLAGHRMGAHKSGDVSE